MYVPTESLCFGGPARDRGIHSTNHKVPARMAAPTLLSALLLMPLTACASSCDQFVDDVDGGKFSIICGRPLPLAQRLWVRTAEPLSPSRGCQASAAPNGNHRVFFSPLRRGLSTHILWSCIIFVVTMIIWRAFALRTCAYNAPVVHESWNRALATRPALLDRRRLSCSTSLSTTVSARSIR
jgi:hypothetical protein